MRILFVSTYAQRCGIAEYCRQLRLALTKLGHQTYVLAEVPPPGQLPVTEEDGVYRIWQRGMAYRAPHGLNAITQAIKSSPTKPDIVHFQHEFGLFQSNDDFHQLTCDLNEIGVKTITTLHTVLAPPYQSSFFNEPILGTMIVHTAAQAAVLGAWRGRNCATIIPHGCPSGELNARSTYSFLCPGFMSPSKGHRTILEAFARLPPHTTMLLAGQCNSDVYMFELENWIKELGLEDRVIVKAAYQENPAAFFDQSRCIVLGGIRPEKKSPPYSASGQLATANGLGVPVIAKNLPIYDDGVALRYNTPEELLCYMENIDSTGGHLVQQGKHLATGRTWQKTAEKHVEAYKSVLQ